jgi:hypothetical protein
LLRGSQGVHVISDGIADASALKMCYGALNKGTQALWLEVLIAAQRLGIADILEQRTQPRIDRDQRTVALTLLMCSLAWVAKGC